MKLFVHGTLNLLQRGRKRRRTFQLFGVFAAYVLAGKIGLAVPFTSGNVSPLWPPAGVALAAMLIFGSRIWPAVALGAFIVNFFTEIPHVAAAGIAVGNTVGPLCGAWSLRQLPRFQFSLTRLRDVLGIGILGAFCGTAVSATVGTGFLFLTGVNAWSGFPSAWLMWWLGDAMGVLIVTPLVLTFTGLMSIRQGRQLVELACLLLGAVGSALVMFDPRLGLMRAEVFAFGVFPFVLWGALRFEAAGAAVVSFLISVIAVLGTAHGFVPLIKGNPLENAILLQSFLGVISVSGMVLAAVVAERAQLIREQSAQEALDLRNKISLLSRAVEQTADSVVITDRQGTIEYVNPAFEATTGYGPEEAIGKTPRILKSALHTKEFYSRLWNQILQGEAFRGTLVNRKKSGQLFWAEQTITPIKDSAGVITHFVSVLKDITEFRKLQEQELQLRLAREVQQRFYTG
ncbi:MAG TPA: MASE1 domain-containing protein, partial [Terriglobales bacterium]